MKKILSILLALGLVVGMVVGAMPAAAQPPAWGGTDWTEVWVTVDPDCELVMATYNITFDAPATLTQGVHSITVQFPEDTGFPPVWRLGHISVNDDDVFPSEITQTGNNITFLVPTTTEVGPISVVFAPVLTPGTSVFTGLVNPEAGDYHLYVKTSRAPMSTWVKSGWLAPPDVAPALRGYYPYEILPEYSTYKFVVDFGANYTGIAEDFWPPFKACDTYEFTLTLKTDDLGCEGWGSANVIAQQKPGNPGAITFNGTTMTAAAPWVSLGQVDLTDDFEHSWDLTIHAATPSPTCEDYYGISFIVETKDPIKCEDPIDGEHVQQYWFKAFQYLDSYAIDLEKKWNLISTPLVPVCSMTSLESALASFAYPALLSSVWHYDRCVDDWFVSGNGFDSLTTFEDGKAYWFRMLTAAEGWPETITSPAVWWVFGTPAPVPPLSPSAYPVCEGWNMVGFTSLQEDKELQDYLWNFYTLSVPLFGPAVKWNATTEMYEAVLHDGLLEPGRGYWIPFADDAHGRFIYPGGSQ